MNIFSFLDGDVPVGYPTYMVLIFLLILIVVLACPVMLMSLILVIKIS